jgi:hypothetical protein
MGETDVPKTMGKIGKCSQAGKNILSRSDSNGRYERGKRLNVRWYVSEA